MFALHPFTEISQISILFMKELQQLIQDRK